VFAKRVWCRIAARAEMAAPRSASPPPALRLVTGERVVRPMLVKGRHIFPVPRGASDVRLISTTARPTDAHPWVEDRRRLGVAVRRIALDGARVVPLDSPALGRGWWPPDPASRWTDGDAGLRLARWTDGDAGLRLAGGARLLELRLAP